MSEDRPMDERLALMRDDPALDLTVDGNGVGGLLAAVFGEDVTANPGQCASCHLRCPACTDVMIRIVQTPRGLRVDARGAAYLELTSR
jgi:hypothetical protein